MEPPICRWLFYFCREGNVVGVERNDNRIDALDGIRAISMMLVVWFHFWQQSWLTPPWPLEPFVRYGAVFVDMLILLSAFLNFLPFARAIRAGGELPDTVTFYKKRFVRIVPSYMFCVAVFFLLAVVEGAYTGSLFWAKDLFHAVTFTSFMNKGVYLGTRITGVLWTVQIEMWYYLLMPFLARAFRKLPMLTSVVLIGSSQAVITYITTYQADKIRLYSNHFLSFAGYYAYGMILCMLYLRLKESKQEKWETAGMTLLLPASVYGMFRLICTMGGDRAQIIQMQIRPILGVCFAVFLLAACFSYQYVQAFLGNKMFRFIALISYNLYLWHQGIAVKLKSYRVPFWEGDVPPNQLGERPWMWKYQFIIIGVSVAVAIVTTYFVEKPITVWYNNRVKEGKTNKDKRGN